MVEVGCYKDAGLGCGLSALERAFVLSVPLELGLAFIRMARRLDHEAIEANTSIRRNLVPERSALTIVDALAQRRS